MSRAARALLAVGLGALILCVSGCRAADLPWEYRIDASVSGAVTIGAYTREGECAAMGPPTTYFTRRGEPLSVTPRALDAGTYCFQIVAYDERCFIVGSGQETLTLPPGDEADGVVILVRPETSSEPDLACLSFLRTLGDAG